MGDFSELTIFSDGSGDFHVNRFRIAFEPPAGKSAATLASELIDRFPTYLHSKYATVEFGNRSHEGKRTLRFHGYAKLFGFDLAEPHDDWVVLIWVDRNVGLTAQTLKREFFVAGDDVKASAGGSVVGAIATAVAFPFAGVLAGAAAGGTAAFLVNRMHFLAGRRSWRISEGPVFGLSGDVFVLETAAVERFSHLAFKQVDKIGDIEAKVPDVWISMLNNFVYTKLLRVVPQKLPDGRWKHRNNVDYVQLSFGKLGGMMADREFQEILRLYPSIMPAPVRRLMEMTE